MPERLHCYTDSEALAAALATEVAVGLRAAIAARGMAVLAVSGGKTPVRFFSRLAQEILDWSKLRVTLVDERWVAQDSDRSNARLVKSHLLQHAAAAAVFVPLHMDAPTPDLVMDNLRARLANLLTRFDVTVLGMGKDGHTASFFPAGDHLAAALDMQGSARVVSMRAPGADEPRVTFTLPVLQASRALYLHIEGEAKRLVWKAAQEDDSMLPIAALRRVAPQLEVFWCP